MKRMKYLTTIILMSCLLVSCSEGGQETETHQTETTLNNSERKEVLQFSYKERECIATNEYYDSDKFYSTEIFLGDNVAYSLDYRGGIPSENESLLKYQRTVTGVTTATLIYGYPNVSLMELGLESEEDARLATQLAVMCVARATEDTKKCSDILDMNNLKPAAGYEKYMEQIKKVAEEIIARACELPYAVDPKVKITHEEAMACYDENKEILILGPYEMNATGYEVTKITAKLDKLPETAMFCDADGNAKPSFLNQEAFYIRMEMKDLVPSFVLEVTAEGYHYFAKVYGTGKDDNVTDYIYLEKYQDALTGRLEIILPEFK